MLNKRAPMENNSIALLAKAARRSNVADSSRLDMTKLQIHRLLDWNKHSPRERNFSDFSNQPDNSAIIDRALIALWLKTTGYGISELKSGHVHYVYLLRHPDYHCDMVVKIRRNHFSSRPKIRIDPVDIRHEGQVLKSLNNVGTPVPKLLWEDYGHGVIVMESLWENTISVQEILEEQRLDGNLARSIWTSMKTLHEWMKGMKSTRGNILEDEFYKDNLYYRFGMLDIPEVDSFLLELYKEEKRIIHGDPSFRNLFLERATGGISIIDFETVHYGNIEFDNAFLKAHFLLLNWNDWQEFEKLCDWFDEWYGPLGYGGNEKGVGKELKLILCTILYRVGSDFKFLTSSTASSEILKSFAIKGLRGDLNGYADLKTLRSCFP